MRYKIDYREPLTPQQKRVLRHVAMDRLNKEIAEEMGIAENTVKHYIYDMCRRVGVHTRVGLAVYACLGYTPTATYFESMDWGGRKNDE